MFHLKLTPLLFFLPLVCVSSSTGNCYRSKRCNNGNLAAAPGTSNHGIGLAVDLNSSAKGVYSWLSKNAHKYGFIRTVASEKWHWEHRVGWKRAPYT